MTSLFDRLKSDCQADWDEYTRHPFVQQLGDGRLSETSFRDYLVQDYLFLIQFARAYALSIYKSRSLKEMHNGLGGLKAILDVEMALHVRLCSRWGISKEQLEAAPEKSETVAYTRFVLDAGNSGDLLDLYTALAPCMIGYGEIGASLASVDQSDNPYREWIEEYASDDYQTVMQQAVDNLDTLAAEMMTEARYPRLKALFTAATNLEADFWQMGMNAANASVS